MGDVTDESPVEGLYNPQMEGKARCVCSKGRSTKYLSLALEIKKRVSDETITNLTSQAFAAALARC